MRVPSDSLDQPRTPVRVTVTFELSDEEVEGLREALRREKEEGPTSHAFFAKANEVFLKLTQSDEDAWTDFVSQIRKLLE